MTQSAGSFLPLQLAEMPSDFLVLDIETRPDDFALRVMGPNATARSAHVREVVCASALKLKIGKDFTVSSAKLMTWDTREIAERDLLANLDAAAASHGSTAGWIATYNGTSHDLPALMTRQLRWWLIPSRGVGPFLLRNHVDLARWLGHGGYRFPSLRDACAGLGISIRPPTFLRCNIELEPYEVMKCELDVLGTTVLLLYCLAANFGDQHSLATAIATFGEEASQLAIGRPHLEAFALNPSLRGPAVPWGTTQ